MEPRDDVINISNESKRFEGKDYIPAEAIINCFKEGFSCLESREVAKDRILALISTLLGEGSEEVREFTKSNEGNKSWNVSHHPQSACMAGNARKVLEMAKSAPYSYTCLLPSHSSSIRESIEICLTWKRMECLRALATYKCWDSAVRDFLWNIPKERMECIPREYFKILVSRGASKNLLPKINEAQFCILLTNEHLKLKHWKYAVRKDLPQVISWFVENRRRF